MASLEEITPRTKLRPRRRASGLLCLVLASLPACRTLGPTTLPGDRFNYNKALAQSSNEQLLLNIVRLRYGEPLHWLEVSSMLSQYTFEAGFNANAWSNDLDTWGPALRAVYGIDGDPSEQTGVDGGVSYSDRPTISYSPVQGEDFASRLLSPVPYSVIVFFIQAGWPIDEVLRLCVDRINGLPNPLATLPSADRSAEGEERFDRVLEILRKAQDGGLLQGVIERSELGNELILAMDPTVSHSETDVEWRKLLGLDLAVERIRLTPRGIARSNDEIAIQTRSLLGTMQVLARFVDPPEDHLKKRMIVEWNESYWTRQGLIIEHSPIPRTDAFVQIRHKNHWYYIADSDVLSKRTFALLTYLYSLQASDVSGRGPVLTVPASSG